MCTSLFLLHAWLFLQRRLHSSWQHFCHNYVFIFTKLELLFGQERGLSSVYLWLSLNFLGGTKALGLTSPLLN